MPNLDTVQSVGGLEIFMFRALQDTTGGALVEAIEVLQRADVDVVKAVALIDRSNGATAKRIAELGVPYVGLVTPRDLGVEQ